jgi:hypothetical protein
MTLPPPNAFSSLPVSHRDHARSGSAAHARGHRRRSERRRAGRSCSRGSTTASSRSTFDDNRLTRINALGQVQFTKCYAAGGPVFIAATFDGERYVVVYRNASTPDPQVPHIFTLSLDGSAITPPVPR